MSDVEDSPIEDSSPTSPISRDRSPTTESKYGCMSQDMNLSHSTTRDFSRRERNRTGSTVRSIWSISSRYRQEIEEYFREYSTDIRDYELVSDIGGVDDISYLYLAKHIPTGELVALKYTDLTLSPDYELLEELTRTISNASALRHNCILPYFTSFVENERLWTVTLPMRAGSCKSLMKNEAADGFSEVIVATIIKEILKAMVYIHDRGFIHNDIRADNILMDLDGTIRITGLRQLVDLCSQGEYQRSVWTLVGENLEWAAPEVVAQNDNFTEKADIYSLGIAALELAFNKTPFDDWAPLRILLSKVKYDLPAPESTPVRKMSKNFYRFVQLCTSKEPTWRPSVRELYNHPFIKQAKNTIFLQKNVIEKFAIGKKHDDALRESSTQTFAPARVKSESSESGLEPDNIIVESLGEGLAESGQ